MHDRDQRVLSWLSDLDPAEQARAIRRLGENDALRDVGAHLTIDRIGDVLKYASGTNLGSQIRGALEHLLEQTELPKAPTIPPPRRRKRREVDPPE
jgi:hypothetical protein